MTPNYAADWKRWCLEKETAYPQSDDTTPATDVALLRQSEREGWRYADELEQQRKADTALLRQAMGTLAYWLEHGETPGAHDMIQRTHDALQERLK